MKASFFKLVHDTCVVNAPLAICVPKLSKRLQVRAEVEDRSVFRFCVHVSSNKN